ncbi:BQ5605_C006g03809 [Microbotryum silenes-dioicae]|uniref:BQ5605_C006g03809 protein n=1 Tax=Microbotryum silenes-dioicae TaxID=796604 RepID=A0A2X0M535_9BASI|nr:BQ5605_C006g03809 [Microbotryum silenes-dioicae]
MVQTRSAAAKEKNEPELEPARTRTQNPEPPEPRTQNHQNPEPRTTRTRTQNPEPPEPEPRPAPAPAQPRSAQPRNTASSTVPATEPRIEPEQNRRMSPDSRDTPLHMETPARRVKLDMPLLKAGSKSRDVARWLAGCEDAVESAEWNYGKIATVHLIREAGSRMEGEGGDWYIDSRDKLKALKTWDDFAAEVKARFVSEKTGLAAEHAFFNAQQSGTFNKFIALLTQERSQAGLASDGTQVIPDELFKRQLLHRCDELLYLRATASPSFALDKFSVNALVAYLQTMWDAITLERATTGMRRLNLRHERGEPTQAVGPRTPRLEGAAKEKAMFEGRCFVCDTVGHISSNCPSKPNTASPHRDPPGSTPGPRMVAAIRAYEDTGDSTAFVGISSDSEDDDERLFALDSEPVRLESNLVPFKALPTVQEGESFKWCGYAFFCHDRTLSPSGRVFYANTHITSTVLHVLSFDIPPQWFIQAAETALTDFVWGGPRRNTVAHKFVFQAREDGGLGLISIGDIVHLVALRFWDAVAGSDEAIWAPLARESWRSLVAATRNFSPWGFFSITARVEKLYRDSTRWGAVVAAARVTLPTIKSELLTLPELLLLPPCLPSLYAEGAKHAYDNADAVAKFAQIADLYWRDKGKGWALHVWARIGQKLKAKALLPKTAVRPARIPLKEDPHPWCFNFFGLTRPFTICKLRRLVNTVRFPGKDGQDRALPGGQPQEPRVKHFPKGTSQSGRQRFWSWLHDRFASAAEQDTHWRLMYDVTPTRKKQHVQGHASSPSCLFCGNDAAVIKTVSHYFFGCAYSASYWSGVLRILFNKLGIEDTDVNPSTFTQEQLNMGLPLLRGHGRTTSKWMWVWLACAIGFQRLHLLRWHVHQRFKKDRVVAPPSIPSALRAFKRDFLSRAGFVPGARDWEV